MPSRTAVDTAEREPPRWLSTAAAADWLGIASRTLYRLIDEGKLPGYRIGRVFRVKEEDVVSFLETCRIEPGTLEHLYPERKVQS